MNRGSIEQRYKVYERHFAKAKENAKKYFKSGSFGVYRKLDIAQFEEIYNEFYKGNKNYARQMIYDFNKDRRYSDAQADVSAEMLYKFVKEKPPDNLKNLLSAEDIEYIKSFMKGDNKEENLKILKAKIIGGKFYDQQEKIWDEIRNSPGLASNGTVEHSYLFGSP